MVPTFNKGDADASSGNKDKERSDRMVQVDDGSRRFDLEWIDDGSLEEFKRMRGEVVARSRREERERWRLLSRVRARDKQEAGDRSLMCHDSADSPHVIRLGEFLWRRGSLVRE